MQGSERRSRHVASSEVVAPSAQDPDFEYFVGVGPLGHQNGDGPPAPASGGKGGHECLNHTPARTTRWLRRSDRS
jgi:hypothetical protein